MKKFSLLAVLMGLMAASLAQANSGPLLNCYVNEDEADVGYSQIKIYPGDLKGTLTTVATPVKGAIQVGEITQSDFEQGSIALNLDDSHFPYVYQSFLVKKGSGWIVQKYWHCDFRYFEETCFGGDEMILQATAPASCLDTPDFK